MRIRHLLLAFVVLPFVESRADHYAGGSITTRCTGGNFHEITLQLFSDCAGGQLLPQSIYLSNDCGVNFTLNALQPVTVEEVSSLCPSELPNSTCNGGTLQGYSLATYRATVFLSPCTNWVINWFICCRGSSLNVQGTPGLYLETIVNNPGGICNAAPEFVNNTVPTVCVGQEVSHDASALDAEGNTLSYALIDARFGSPAPLPVLYGGGYSGAEPFDGMTIDPVTGEVRFVPSAAGAIIVVVEVTETGTNGQVLGKVMRDFLFVVTACNNQPPSASSGTFTASTGPASIVGDRSLSVCGTGAFCASITITDPDVGQQLLLSTDLASSLPGATLSIAGTNPAVVQLCWDPVTTGSYPFTITATDNSCPYAGTRTYAYDIVVTSAPNPGINGTATVCENGAPFAMLDSLNGFPTLSGQWVDPNGEPTNGIFTPGLSLNGIHTYTVGQPPCSASSVLSVVTLASNEPACITAGSEELRSFIPRVQQDPSQGHHLWISDLPHPTEVTLLSADGRLLHHRSLPPQHGGSALIEVPAEHTGVLLVHLRSLPSGARHVERIVVQ
ncbi:MAG: hypothetical protein JNN32_01430 [Flavobacteriales bacterium]|nr:hypothetical protein [Flavobacteriales bacterium]